MIFCSCDRNNKAYEFGSSDIDKIKKKIQLRYSEIYDDTKMCIALSYLDFISDRTEFDSDNSKQFDLIYEGFAFKYHQIDFERMSLILVKNLKTKEVYLFTNQLILDLENLSTKNYSKVFHTSWSDLSNNPEFEEFNGMVSGISDERRILGLFLRAFSFDDFLNYPKCLFGEVLWQEREIDTWMNVHLKSDSIEYNYEDGTYFFDAQGLGLLKVSISEYLAASVLPKVYPNDIDIFLKGDKKPIYAGNCP